jgi:4-amino-4-deoxy-L-arabinose transferase-like glycosyltransferase
MLLAHAALLLWIMATRLPYPYPLEWLEGDEFHHALRILQGRSWYPAPGVDFLPSYYPPGYPVIGAAWMQVFGATLPALRGLSAVATLMCAVALFLMVRRRTPDPLHGAVAAGFFLASYAVCGGWFDVARVDMLALACVLWGVLLLHRDASRTAFGIGIGLLVTAAWVKQNHLAFLLLALVPWFFWSWKRALAGMLGAALASTILLLGLQRASDGWFLFYTWTFPGLVKHEWHTLPEFLRVTGLELCGWTLPLVVIPFLRFLRRDAARDAWDVYLVVGFLVVSLAVALSGWTNPAGYVNNVIPVAAAWSWLVAVALGRLRDSGRTRWWAAAQVLVIVQLAMLLGDPRPWCPTAADRVAGDEVVQLLSRQPGPVLAPYHPYFLHLAGHPMHLHFHLVNEILRARAFGFEVQDNDLLRTLLLQLEQRHWRAYVSTFEVSMGELHNTWIDVRAQRRYRKVRDFVPLDDTTTLIMRTGNPVRPAALYVPVTNGRAPTRDGS